MAKVIVMVGVGLLLLVYGAFFLNWNMTPAEVTGLHWFGGVRFSQMLPLGSLVFIGLILGAAIMAVAAWTVWAAQKAVADRNAAMVKKAKVKLQAQLDEMTDLRGQVEQLQAQMESLQAGDGTWGRVDHADLEAAEGVAPCAASASPPAPDALAGAAASAPQAGVDDPDVI